jgi:20S proteasome subunit alpha 3
MARRYDSGTTTFSPEGRLYQVEYAIGAINNAPASVGILSREGVVIAAEKKVASKLLAPPKSSEKMLKIDEHILASVAGAWLLC